MTETDVRSRQKSPTGSTVANLCCLAGVLLITYGSYLVHPALAFVTSGVLFVAYGVYRQRAN